MKSICRQECQEAVEDFSFQLRDTSGTLAYIGIAGDPIGGEYSPLFPNYKVTTIDADIKWAPDIIHDITKPLPILYDLIVCVQVIEHVAKIHDLPYSFYNSLKQDGYLIIDCPWNYPYHAEPPSFGDYWRISKDGFRHLFTPYFTILEIKEGTQNTSCLMKRR